MKNLILIAAAFAVLSACSPSTSDQSMQGPDTTTTPMVMPDPNPPASTTAQATSTDTTQPADTASTPAGQ